MHPSFHPLVPALLVSLLATSPRAQTPVEPPSPAAPPAGPAAAPSRPRPDSGVAKQWTFRALVGATRWGWEEIDMKGARLLEEDGWIPSARLQCALRERHLAMTLAAQSSFGAVDYDGGTQDEAGNVTPLQDHTHYWLLAFEGSVFFVDPVRDLPVDLGAKIGRESRSRTISSTSYDDPGKLGYVETWTSLSLQPIIALKHRFNRDLDVRIELGRRFFLSNNERITKLPVRKYIADESGVDTVETRISATLKPKLDASWDVQVQARWRMLVAEAEYVSEDYDASDVNRFLGIYQPDSYLDRFDLRIGVEF